MRSGKDLAVVILAGGEGRRMGGDKPQRMLAGRTLLQRAVEQALRWSNQVSIAARSNSQPGQVKVPMRLDPPGLFGPIAGIASARQIDQRFVLFIPCDMPFLPDDLPSMFLAAIGGHAAVVAKSNGQVHPVCSLWRSEALGRLDDYLETGRRSVIGFAELVGYGVVEGDRDAFMNVNDPQDLAGAAARLT